MYAVFIISQQGLWPMSDMLTAKEMQDLLQVDRSTIYRMAEAGQLPAIKVGKQWRFPGDQLESWLKARAVAPEPPSAVGSAHNVPVLSGGAHRHISSLLPLECVQLIQDIFAETAGVMMVVTDMEGNPVTRVS